MPQIIHRAAALSPALAQCLQRNVQPDLLAILEAVGDCFRRFVDLDRYTVDEVLLDAGMERVAGESHDAQRQVRYAYPLH